MVITSCYTVKEKTLISKSRYPTTEQLIDGPYYFINPVEGATVENPYETVGLAKGSRYRYQTMERYEVKKEMDGGATIGLGLAFSGLGGLIFARNPEWFDENTTPERAFLAGASLVGLSWLIFMTIFEQKKTVYIEKPGYEFDYKKEEIIANNQILIITKNTEKEFLSDAKGLVKFSPPFDFQLNEFKTNDSVEFLFSSGKNKFINSLIIRPSGWMDQYAKITVPKTTILSEKDYESIGYAREGMLYKVLGRHSDTLHIETGSKSGLISSKDAEVYYTRNTNTDLSPAIKAYVIDEMQKWLKQDEFELPEDYLQRISKKDEQLLIFTNEAMKTFQKEHAKMFDWNKATISNYDPNSQTFKVNIPGLKEIVISVPIENAKEFKKNWEYIEFKNQEFTMIDGKWELASLQIEDLKQNYTANYDSNIQNHYDPLNQFAFDSKDFEPDLSKLPVNRTKAVTEVFENEKYQINVNLPETGMQNPDAIAVVIGNASYEKTSQVDFALNDAQLMKLYLTHVLGFKDGNIIFVMNAGKADFEGLFGTESNYKGKLFNYIKPQVSDVFIFYSGHGAPDPTTSEAYFVPTDCDPDYLNLQAYALKTFYSNLARLPSKSTTVIIDACFSGAGVNKNISSVRIKPKDTENDIPNSAIMNSSSGAQVSSWYSEARQGLFTYFFLKAIHDYKNSDKNGDNQLTFGEIYDYVSDKTNGVPYFARRLNAVEQTPVLKGSNSDMVFVRFSH